MITLYAILGINEVPNAFTRMHETFESAEIELDQLFLKKSEKAIERLSKTREILKEKARIEMARRAEEAKLKHKKPTKPNSVIIYRRVKKKKRKQNL